MPIDIILVEAVCNCAKMTGYTHTDNTAYVLFMYLLLFIVDLL